MVQKRVNAPLSTSTSDKLSLAKILAIYDLSGELCLSDHELNQIEADLISSVVNKVIVQKNKVSTLVCTADFRGRIEASPLICQGRCKPYAIKAELIQNFN